jgi:putative colanic acid biosynthesis acetyltransferase WcaB
MTQEPGRIVTFSAFRRAIGSDMRANPRDPKARLVLFAFRFSQWMMGNLDSPRALSIPFIVVYRLMTEFVLGIELRPKTSVGVGLSIYHGMGLVVNDHAVLGENVVLRNGVTIGHQHPGGASPRLCNGVTVGANALILGDITVGEGAVVGAGAVVVRSVEPWTAVAGNPARKIRDLPRPMP